MTDYDYGWKEGIKYIKGELIELVKSKKFIEDWKNAPNSMTFSEFCAKQIEEIK